MTKILIVDDKEENLYLLENIFDVKDFKTIAARNGKEALDLALDVLPDLIVADILMPIMDGYSLCRECKNDERLKDIPFVFYTATYTDPKDEEFAKHLGAAAFILKPQEPEDLLDIICKVLEEENPDRPSLGLIEEFPEEVVLKEYNQTLVRKLEDKMFDAEKAQQELQKNNALLEQEILERKNIERSLKESEERFRSFYNNAVVGLYRTTPGGEILLVNEALAKMLGFDNQNEIIGKNLNNPGLIHQTERQRFIETIEKEGEIKELEGEWLRKDGVTIYVRESAKAIRGDNGETVFYDGVVEDITARRRTEAALEESRQLFQTLADVSPVGIFKTDVKGNTIYVNARWMQLSGLSFEEAMGFGWLNAVHPEDREHLTATWGFATKQFDSSEAKYRFLKPDGTVVWVIGHAVPEIIDDQVVGYVGTITDVTELKQSEQQLASLSRAVEQSPVLIMLTDLDGTIQYVNPVFEETTGYSAAEIVGQNPRILKSGETPVAHYDELWKTITAGNTWKGELQTRKKNGDLFWESILVSPILNKAGEIINYLSISEDITGRKEAEAALIHAKTRAEEMNRLKTSFLANMSHELRTPLISILGFSDIIRDEVTDAGLKQMANNINKGGIRLLSTLNHLLQFSRIESEAVNPRFENVEINPVLKELLFNFAPEAEAKGLELQLGLSAQPLIIQIDLLLFKDVVNNLISNALKFTREGYIKLSTWEEDAHVVIEIADSGIGIPDQHKQTIFEEFRQVSEGLGRSFEGTGLGLTIAQKYTHLLKGDISVESQMNAGSAFRLRFPSVQKPEQPATEEGGGIPEPRKSPEILYVEDDESTRELITLFLRDICIVDCAATGEEALQKIELKTYDLFLMDMNLGEGMDGRKVTKIIREMPRYNNTPIIALTAFAHNSDRDNFIAAGCSHFLAKPFIKNEFIGLLRKLLHV